MKKEMTIYKNDINSIPLRKFNSIEMDLFFSICTQMRNKDSNIVEFSFKELQNMIGYKAKNSKRFAGYIQTMYAKLLNITFNTYSSESFLRQGFVLFTDYIIDEKNQFAEISINSKYVYLLNDITKEFTKFELEEFTNLKSIYSKTAFRLLKQYRLTGYFKISIEKFRYLLDIPDSYPMKEISRRILEPIFNELSPIFKNLTIKKIKGIKQNKIEYLEFCFIPQDDIQKGGTKTFKDENGKYYENDIEHFTKEEVNKSFPTP